MQTRATAGCLNQTTALLAWLVSRCSEGWLPGISLREGRWGCEGRQRAISRERG